MINLTTHEWEIKNIETVLLDKDGTFIDLHYFWGKITELRVKEIINKFKLDDKTFNDLCLCLGFNPTSKKMLADGITALYSRVKIIEIFKKDLEKYNIKTTDEEIAEIFDFVSKNFYKEFEKYTKPINAAIEFIKNLHKKGVKLGIVTSDSLQATTLTLKHLDLEYIFDTVIGRESSIHPKESGEPTKLALEQLKANPKTTIMIGDAPMDYISAQKAGIEKTILVATGQISKEKLQETTSYCINSLNDLKITNSIIPRQ